MLASSITNFHSCQIIFIVGVCLKPVPLRCGLGNMLDESLAQNLCFSNVKWLTMDGTKSIRKVKKEFFKNLISLDLKICAYFFSWKVHCGLSNMSALNVV